MEIIKTQTTPIQQFSALNAFKSNKNLKPVEEVQDLTETSNGVKTASIPNLLDRIDVNDIRRCAETVGEFNITDEDIRYGLLYGRSVIAEWLC